jgi:site-specific recombinase XerD
MARPRAAAPLTRLLLKGGDDESLDRSPLHRGSARAISPKGFVFMRILLASQEAQLFSAIRPGAPFGPRDHALIRFLLHTGLRSAEVCSLNVGDVLTWDGFPRQWLEVVGKGRRARQVPLNNAARQAVLDLVHFNRSRGFAVAGESPLLVTRCHRRLPTRTLRALVQHYREQADLDLRCSPHTFRHTMASRLADRASLPVVQAALGHKRLTSTAVYTHVTPEQLAAGVQRLV